MGRVQVDQAITLAKQRGYFSHPDVVRVSIPAWFDALGQPEGVAAFEQHHGVTLSPSLRRYFAHPDLARVLEVSSLPGAYGYGDVEVLLNDLADCCVLEPPFTVTWNECLHLVTSFHGHSGSVCAADLTDNNSHIRCGFLDDPEPLDQKSTPFGLHLLTYVTHLRLP